MQWKIMANNRMIHIYEDDFQKLGANCWMLTKLEHYDTIILDIDICVDMCILSMLEI